MRHWTGALRKYLEVSGLRKYLDQMLIAETSGPAVPRKDQEQMRGNIIFYTLLVKVFIHKK